MEYIVSFIVGFFSYNLPKEVLTGLMASFSGAFFAFYYNQLSESEKKHQEQINILKNAIVTSASAAKDLYNFRKQHNLRFEEAPRILKAFKNREKVSFQETSKYILKQKKELNLSPEKLGFVVSKEPQILILLDSVISSWNTHELTIERINKILEDVINSKDELHLSESQGMMLAEYNNFLCSESWGDTLFIIEFLIDILCKYGSLEFKKDFSSFKYSVGPEYQMYKPNPVKGWNKDDYFKQKFNWFNKFIFKGNLK